MARKSKTKKTRNIARGDNGSGETIVPSSSIENVPVVVYRKPQKKISSKSRQLEIAVNKGTNGPSDNMPNVKQLKLDVYRLLARSSTSVGEKDGASSKHALAIALGAEPPKRKAVNYKQLQEDIKNRRPQEQQSEILRKISDVNLAKKKGDNMRKGRRHGGGTSGNNSGSGIGLGKWKGGVLRLSKEDVTRIKTHKFLKI